MKAINLAYELLSDPARRRAASAPEPLSIATSALPAARAGEPYRARLAAVGGAAPYAWEAVLPAGLGLDALRHDRRASRADGQLPVHAHGRRPRRAHGGAGLGAARRAGAVAGDDRGAAERHDRRAVRGGAASRGRRRAAALVGRAARRPATGRRPALRDAAGAERGAVGGRARARCGAADRVRVAPRWSCGRPRRRATRPSGRRSGWPTSSTRRPSPRTRPTSTWRRRERGSRCWNGASRAARSSPRRIAAAILAAAVGACCCRCSWGCSPSRSPGRRCCRRSAPRSSSPPAEPSSSGSAHSSAAAGSIALVAAGIRPSSRPCSTRAPARQARDEPRTRALYRHLDPPALIEGVKQPRKGHPPRALAAAIVGCALLMGPAFGGSALAAAGPRYDVPRGFIRCPHAVAWTALQVGFRAPHELPRRRPLHACICRAGERPEHAPRRRRLPLPNPLLAR